MEIRMSVKVYEAIAAITGELSKIGIAKLNTNKTQGYKFRGIDDVYGVLSPLLSRHKLCILPRVIERSVIERESKNGGTLFYTTLKVEFDFVSAEDASKHTVCTVGEAMDSGDKSSNKSMSAAYKYACFQTFCIPTEGDNDADAEAHELLTPAQVIGKKFVEALKVGIDEAVVEADQFARTSLKKDRDAAWALLTKEEKEAIVVILNRAKAAA
jgi:hypothetical protein